MHLPPFLPLLTLLISSSTAKSYTKSKDAVLLSTVRTLTLHGEKQTSHRRVSAIPQLKCVGGSAKGLYDVDIMRCKNSGSEYDPEDIQWTCQASLPPEFKLGGTEVVCEGFDSPDDPYILKGSCGVEYRLVLTEAGEAKYARNWLGQRPMQEFGGRGSSGGKGVVDTFWTVLFWAVFIAILCTLLYKLFAPANPNIRLPNLGGGNGFFGGGGGGGDDNDPPPPYTPRAPPRSKPWSSAPTSNNPLGGFWGGAATGAAVGYWMGNRNSRDRERERAREREFERQRQSSSWFGPSAGPSRSPGGGGGSSFAGPSGTRYESTGFGGTRRR